MNNCCASVDLRVCDKLGSGIVKKFENINNS